MADVEILAELAALNQIVVSLLTKSAQDAASNEGGKTGFLNSFLQSGLASLDEVVDPTLNADQLAVLIQEAKQQFSGFVARASGG